MIYTSVAGDIDPPRNDLKSFPDGNVFRSPRMAAKVFKVLSHLYSDEPTVWVDGNIFPLLPEWELIGRCLIDADLALFQHPFRKTIAEEYAAIKELKMVGEKPSFPSGFKDSRLFECGVLIRRNNAAVRQFNEAWWSLICRYSERDQLTCPIAMFLSPDLRVNVIQGNVRSHKWFKYVKHHPPEPKPITLEQSQKSA